MLFMCKLKCEVTWWWPRLNYSLFLNLNHFTLNKPFVHNWMRWAHGDGSTLLHSQFALFIFKLKVVPLSFAQNEPELILLETISSTVPGDGGSQVEAKLTKPDTVHYYCEKNADYFNIWLNPKLLVPLVIDCWIDNVRLTYDPVTRTTSNTPGVDIRIPGFGRSEVVEWLDPSFTKSLAGAYFKDVANALASRGYQRNITLRGAPYDFRKAPSRCFFFRRFEMMLLGWKNGSACDLELKTTHISDSS